MDFSFDPRLELDRAPTGAVPAGTTVRFGIRAAQALDVGEMLLEALEEDSGRLIRLPMEPVWTEKGFTRFECGFAPPLPGLYWYRFSADGRPVGRTPKGAAFAQGEPVSWQLTAYDPDYTTPGWICGGCFYHIFVDRFNKAGSRPVRPGAVFREDWGGTPCYLPDGNGVVRNNDFFGGDLDGVIEKLPYLAELGVTCIYLSPIFEAASNHKYDTSDYMKIDPSFGDEETFACLCAKARELGMRVICDGVFNHTGDDSVYFDKYGHYGGNGAYSSESSPYFNWYSFTKWPDEYESWWGIKTLPQVREEDAGYRRFILGKDGVLEKWMSLGASGWRLDVADELPESFLRELRQTVKGKDPQALIIGEVWEDASNKVAYGFRRHYFQGAELDSVMNYPFKNAIIGYMLTGRAEDIGEAVETICENYPKPALDCLMNSLGTHDTPRILTVLSGKEYASREERANARLTPEEREQAREKLFLAAALQCTLPGVPCIYYGDEAGMEGYEDPFNRRCYPWGAEDGAIRDWYAALLGLRRACPALAGGEYRTITAADGFFAFRRLLGSERVYTAVNMGDDPVDFQIPQGGTVLLSHRCEAAEGFARLLPGGCAIAVKRK